MSNPFLNPPTAEGISIADLQNGTAQLNISTLEMTSLSPNLPVTTDGGNNLVSSLISISDVANLESTLATFISNPLTSGLNANGNNITNVGGLTIPSLADGILMTTSGVVGSETSIPQSSVTGLVSSLATINSNVATNTTNIASNTSAITTLNGEVATNTTNIASNTSAITTLNGEVATNTTNIASNTSDITTLNGEVATNTTNIASNTSAINTINTEIAALPSTYLPLSGGTMTGNIIPSITNTDNLGSSSLEWNNLYSNIVNTNTIFNHTSIIVSTLFLSLQSNSIQFACNIVPDITNTHALGSSTYTLSNVYSNTFTGTSATLGTSLTTPLISGTGAITLSPASNSNLVLNPSGTGIVSCVGNIVPSITNTDNLGSSSLQWNNLYAGIVNVGTLFNASSIIVSTTNLSLQANNIQFSASMLPALTNSYTLGSSTYTLSNVYSNAFTGTSATLSTSLTTPLISGTGAITLSPASNNNLVLNPSGTGIVSCAGNIVPSVNNTDNLGSSSLTWANLYANSITGTTGTLSTSLSTPLISSSAAISLTPASNSNINLNASGTGIINCVGNIVPSVTNVNNLGSSSIKWSNLYATTVNGTTGTFSTSISAPTASHPTSVTTPLLTNTAAITLTPAANSNIVLNPSGTGVVSTAGSIVPSVNNTYTLGSAALQYSSIYGTAINGNAAVINTSITNPLYTSTGALSIQPASAQNVSILTTSNGNIAIQASGTSPNGAIALISSGPTTITPSGGFTLSSGSGTGITLNVTGGGGTLSTNCIIDNSTATLQLGSAAYAYVPSKSYAMTLTQTQSLAATAATWLPMAVTGFSVLLNGFTFATATSLLTYTGTRSRAMKVDLNVTLKTSAITTVSMFVSVAGNLVPGTLNVSSMYMGTTANSYNFSIHDLITVAASNTIGIAFLSSATATLSIVNASIRVSTELN